jgi:hypothetical protein
MYGVMGIKKQYHSVGTIRYRTRWGDMIWIDFSDASVFWSGHQFAEHLYIAPGALILWFAHIQQASE